MKRTSTHPLVSETAALITPETSVQASGMTEEQAFNALVQAQVASATSALESRIATMEAEHASAITALETQHATALAEAVQRAETAEAALTQMQQEEATRQLVASRSAAVASIANCPEGYVTDERAARWACLDEDTFNGVVEDLTAAWAGAPKSETARFGTSSTKTDLNDEPKSSDFFANILKGGTNR